MTRTLLLSLWLPLAVAAQAMVRFGPGTVLEPTPAPLMAMAIGTLFVFTWPAGIPLTAAVRRLHARSPRAAYACAAVLGPLTTAAATIGGLLGPIAVWLYALVLSVPAWLVLWLLARRQPPATA
ncbi:MAG: hypothetical protein OXH75_18475 [Acidobacteria bacterium]|nr:hypothetical protein [Acidobacteriota bacterium]